MPTAIELLQFDRLQIDAMIGDAQREVSYARPISELQPNTLTFAGEKFDSNRLAAYVSGLQNCTLLCNAALANSVEMPETTILVTETPRLSFMRAINQFFPPAVPSAGIDPTACVDPTAIIDSSAHIGAHCVIGAGSKVGANTIIHPAVIIYPGVNIGANCRINSGTVIGADGFGYERNAEGELEKFPHIGGVLIGDDVEIGSNTSIDRGSLGNTIIKDGARIDNQVHIAHNVVVGRNAAVIAQAMIGGSVTIGDGAWIAPSAVIMNQVAIGSDATVGLGAVATKNVADGQVVMGSPAQDNAEFKATRAALKRLVNG